MSQAVIARTFVPDMFAGMNRWEKRRAIELEAMRRDGMIVSWVYEGVTLKLADDTRYTPDFLVIEADGTLRFEEVKGFWRDDALVKIKVAAQRFPFRFVSLSVVKGSNGWTVRDFTAWGSPG